MGKTAYKEVLELKGKVPEVVYEDVVKRCGDWLEDEMNREDDRYIEKQLEFGRKFVKK